MNQEIANLERSIDHDMGPGYFRAQIERGIQVEHEHTKGLPAKQAREIATTIALDHIAEFPDYYERLERLEAEARACWRR